MTDYNVYRYEDCPREVFHFRYKIYVEEIHYPQAYADHEEKTIIDPMDPTGRHGVVTKDGEIIAAVRLNMVRDGSVDLVYDFYEMFRMTPEEQQTASICTRNMVASKFRKTGVSVRMLQMIYEDGIRAGATSCFMDTDPPLVPLFSKFGFVPLFEKEHPEYGLVSVMKLPSVDLDHLSAARSPFAPICRKFLEETGALTPA